MFNRLISVCNNIFLSNNIKLHKYFRTNNIYFKILVIELIILINDNNLNSDYITMLYKIYNLIMFYTIAYTLFKRKEY